MDLKGKKITLHDMTLRDGMHPKRHLMTIDQMKTIAQGLDNAGVPLIEVTHGDGLGAGAGNTPLEVLVAVCDRMGIETGVDVWRIQDVAEDLVTPIMDFPIRVDRDSLTLGYAGVYGSFLLFAKRAEAKYGIPAREILLELGRRKMVGGQEDMIEDAALTMARERKEGAAKAA